MAFTPTLTSLTNTHKVSSTQMVVKAKRINLGIDVHADSYRVVRQVDEATPQPALKFSPEAFMLWVKKQLMLAEEVHSCYEAGPLGYGLHRALTTLGVDNRVIRPQNWDGLGRESRPTRPTRWPWFNDWIVTCKAIKRHWR